MIPKFPKFKKLQIKDKQEIEKFTKKYPPYSDFNFVSMWIYNVEDKYKISVLNNNLVVKFQDYKTQKPFFSFLGSNKTLEAVEILLSKADKIGIKPVLKLIPEISINKEIKQIRKKFRVTLDRGNFDYIFHNSEKSEMKGRRYFNRRKIINKFTKRYPKHKVKLLDLKNRKTKKEIEKLCLLWVKRKSSKVKSELIVMKRLFKLTYRFNFLTLGVYIENKLIAFLASEKISDKYALAHFSKSDISRIGVTPYLSHQVARYLNKIGCKYLNYEQDLNIPGLRKSKQMWHPKFYLRKYTINPK